MSTPTVDYDALAKQYGATSSQSATSQVIDYDALAKQHGAISSAPGTVTGSTATIKAAPQPWTVPWLKEKLYNIADSLTDSLPAAGATTGAIIGGGGGTILEPGGGSAVGAVGGAGIGGMAGEALKQHVRRALGFEVPNTPEEAAREITKQGVIQGGTQAVAEVLPFGAGPLKNAAEAQYERALAPTTKVNKAITEKIVPEMMDRGVHGSLDSIAGQASNAAADLRPQIDSAIEAIPENELNAFLKRYNVPAVPGGTTDEIRSALAAKHAQNQVGSAASTVPSRVLAPPNQIADQVGTQASTIPESVFGAKQGTSLSVESSGPTSGAGKKVYDALENLRQSYIVDGKVADPQAVNAIEGVQKVVSQFGDDISAKSLRRLRQIFDNPVAKAGGFNGGDLSTAYALQAKQEAANSIRDILAEASPDVARLNKEMSFWLNVQKVAEESAARQTGQQGGLLKVLGPLGAGAAAAAGFGAHGAVTGLEAGAGSALITAVGMATRTPRWRTASALFKNSLADSLAAGDVSRATALLGRLGVAVPAAIQATDKQGQTATQ